MHAVHHAKFAVMHVFTHLFVLAAGQAEIVLEALAGGVELVANAGELAC